MFNIFKKLFKMSTKQELEQQTAEAITVAQRLNEELKTLRVENSQLKVENESLKKDFISAIERTRYLDGQVKMLESQRQASNKYSDKERNY